MDEVLLRQRLKNRNSKGEDLRLVALFLVKQKVLRMVNRLVFAITHPYPKWLDSLMLSPVEYGRYLNCHTENLPCDGLQFRLNLQPR